VKTLVDILYEDNHLLAINKPPGLLSQGDNTGDPSALELCKEYIKEEYNKPGAVYLGLVHRIDRPVSGVLLMARTSKALERLNAQMKAGEIKKTYWALTERQPEELGGRLTHWLEKDTSKNTTTAHRKDGDNRKKSVLDYSLVRYIKGKCLLEVRPQTGRSHQIRVQLSKINCPIIGDTKYGWKGKREGKEIALHASKVEFVHPVTKEKITIEAPTDSNAAIGRFMRLK